MKAFSIVSDWGSSCIASPCWSADGKFAQVKLESAVKLGWEVVGARATNMGANGCLKLNIVAPPLNEKHSKLLLSRTAIVWRAFWYSFHSYFRLLSWTRVVFFACFQITYHHKRQQNNSHWCPTSGGSDVGAGFWCEYGRLDFGAQCNSNCLCLASALQAVSNIGAHIFLHQFPMRGTLGLSEQ